MTRLAVRVEARHARRRPAAALVFVGAMALAMVAALASVGGVGHAASAVSGAAEVVQQALSPSRTTAPQRVRVISAGGDQYRPGFGFGDPNHNHAGPPGLQANEAARPRGPRRIANHTFVRATVTLDEQAALWISVVDPNGRQVPIVQLATTIDGNRMSGPPAKNIKYVVLVPRVLTLNLAILRGERPAGDYRIVLIAVDPDGNKSRTEIEEDLPADIPVSGTARADRVQTGRGDDRISTGNGNDRIASGGGADVVSAGLGNDFVFAGFGDDRVAAGPGNDFVNPGPGNDIVFGGPGNDRIRTADFEVDTIFCGPGFDRLFADSFDRWFGCERVTVR